MEKTFYLIGGANGSGKTTFAREFLKKENIPFLNADEIAKRLCPSDPQKVSVTAGFKLFAQLNDVIQKGQSFALETTLAGRTYLNKINDLHNNGYKICLIYVFLDGPQTCIERIKERVKKGGHYVPDEDVKRRYLRSVKNFWDCYKEVADIWTIYYNGTNLTIPVATGQHGQFDVLDGQFYKLFMKSYNSVTITNNQILDKTISNLVTKEHSL